MEQDLARAAHLPVEPGSQYEAGIACAREAGMTVDGLVTELQDAAAILEQQGHAVLAQKLRNWAICIAGALTASRQSGKDVTEIYLG